MSNFTCPTCGLTNIDCGKAGYKTAREIELEKELESARWYQTVQNEDISKLRGLLRECLAHLSLGEIGTSVTPLNILLTRINAAIGESEEK